MGTTVHFSIFTDARLLNEDPRASYKPFARVVISGGGFLSHLRFDSFLTRASLKGYIH